jgi:glutathione S-transferase
MKLHWSPRSPYVRKVLIAACELGLQEKIELRRTVVAMSSTNPDIRGDNPLNKIPTLVLDDGLAIFDSYVICEYLDGLAAGRRIIPEGGRERLVALRMHSLGQGLIDLLILARNERDRPELLRSDVHLVAFAEKRRATIARLEVEAATLRDTDFGVGQIAVGCALAYSDYRFAAEPWRESAPRLADWHAAFEARESVRQNPLRDG